MSVIVNKSIYPKSEKFKEYGYWGIGSEEFPYLIENAEQWFHIRDVYSGTSNVTEHGGNFNYFQLEIDIDFNDTELCMGLTSANWSDYSFGTNSFSQLNSVIIDGNEHFLKNLVVKSSSKSVNLWRIKTLKNINICNLIIFTEMTMNIIEAETIRNCNISIYYINAKRGTVILSKNFFNSTFNFGGNILDSVILNNSDKYYNCKINFSDLTQFPRQYGSEYDIIYMPILDTCHITGRIFLDLSTVSNLTSFASNFYLINTKPSNCLFELDVKLLSDVDTSIKLNFTKDISLVRKPTEEYVQYNESTANQYCRILTEEQLASNDVIKETRFPCIYLDEVEN